MLVEACQQFGLIKSCLSETSNICDNACKKVSSILPYVIMFCGWMGIFCLPIKLTYTPQIYLKMCIYFSGGGRLEIEVNHTLTVDGYIMANSEDVLSVSSWSGASGGSGGSILINTVNFTGK